MNDDSNSGFGASDKPPKRKRGSQDRYAFHQCFHGDALLGVAMLDDGERGVYITIVWTMYQQRSALPLDYSWLARINNIPVQRLRVRLKALVARGRIVIDEENGLVYDERAMRELVAAERYNQAQAERAKASWKNRPPAKAKPQLRVVAPAEVADIAAALANVSGGDSNQTPPQTPLQPGSLPPTNRGVCFEHSEQNQDDKNSRAHANHIHNHKTPTTGAQSPRSAPAPAATLPLRGSGGGDLKKQRQAAALDALKQLRPAKPTQGFEGSASGQSPAPDPAEPAPPADRRAKRTEHTKKRSA